jgi:nucleoside-diphosphate-sugar epimerase
MLEATQVRFDVFNIGSGRVTTVGEVAKLALRFAGHSPARLVYDSDSPTTTAHLQLDCTKARNVLGWQPEVTPQEGIRRTVEWWKASRETWQK